MYRQIIATRKKEKKKKTIANTFQTFFFQTCQELLTVQLLNPRLEYDQQITHYHRSTFKQVDTNHTEWINALNEATKLDDWAK